MGVENSNNYLVGAKKDADGNIDTGRALNMIVDSDDLIKVEKARDLQNTRNIQEVFYGMSSNLGPEDQNLSLLLQEQGPLIGNYLKKDTPSGQGGEVYNKMAPGVAILGYQMANSGFGRHEIITGDKQFDGEHESMVRKSYKAADELFGQLMQKMYPEGTSHGDSLLIQLDEPLDKMNEGLFAQLKKALEELYVKGLPFDNKGIIEYRNIIDSLIQSVGGELGVLAEIMAKNNMSSQISPEDLENRQGDILTLAMALKELHNLRRRIVRHKYGSSAYDNFSPLDLKKIENLEVKVQGQ